MSEAEVLESTRFHTKHPDKSRPGQQEKPRARPNPTTRGPAKIQTRSRLRPAQGDVDTDQQDNHTTLPAAHNCGLRAAPRNPRASEKPKKA
ncbi:hypothetical protein PCANC_27182 [Puccinia coronata f. sp. avenae]|uniref:Uncharacterized protein n=1 Tax=Puccinia coronata f. sp. avenae TaxID=200324 RepID=A0A2N5TQF1_9BASI|nr:hypothetical protein PCANC_27182 [Puccinia coronata f. sp. avenae]PLW27730.1 hypothetical protein PCASD_20602 [Puccinia coronata f. sp. avenae]